VQKCEGDPTVGSKVMAILTPYSSLGHLTSSSQSWDSISTRRKTASGNSCKKFKRDPTVGSKVFGIFTGHSSLADETSSSSSWDSITTLRETASGNSCKNLSAIHWSDRMLWPFDPLREVWPTRPPRRRVAIP
jgi:hypothetical protein